MKPIIIAHLGENDYIKAMRRAARDEEIARYGRLIETRPMKHACKKAYKRHPKYHIDYEF